MSAALDALVAEVRACDLCSARLPLGPKPVLQVSPTARLLIIGQAPGSKAHNSGVPWDDQSGKRLREWTGLTDRIFYDPQFVAILPIGLCYPGANPQGGDHPPLLPCAPLWHPRLLPHLTQVRLTLLVGMHAQRHYLGAKGLLTDNVARFAEFLPLFPLPHPSWRVVNWMKQNDWFETAVIPHLRDKVAEAVGGGDLSTSEPQGDLGTPA